MGILVDLFGPGTWGTGGNLVASAILGILGTLAAWLGRHRIQQAVKTAWAMHHPHKDELAEIKAAAEAAHRIAADTYERHTGQRHPDSPEFKGATQGGRK